MSIKIGNRKKTKKKLYKQITIMVGFNKDCDNIITILCTVNSVITVYASTQFIQTISRTIICNYVYSKRWLYLSLN